MGNQRQAVSDVELARLAGFFAGEGSITIASNNVLFAALGNTERFWVERFHRLFDGSFTIEQPKYLGAKVMYRWRVTGKGAKIFLETIQPFLVGEKAEQLITALRFQALKLGAPHRYTFNALREMEKLRTEMRDLRRAAAETNRENAAPRRSDSPTLPVMGENIAGQATDPFKL